jgi:hypothetical protein
MRDYPLTGVMYIHGEYDGDKGDVNGARTGEFIHRIYARFLRHFLKDSEYYRLMYGTHSIPGVELYTF